MAKRSTLTPRFQFSPTLSLDPKRVRLTPDPVESYDDRTGYDPAFIDSAMPIALPGLNKALKRDAASYTRSNKKTYELPYTHFSTIVSKSRRLPILSACNIDGSQAKNVARRDMWKFDPRIPQQYQILQEVYGDEKNGYFSRGHMTRRRDPDWGPKAVAVLADADTFHATNAAPQVQRFNGGLWVEIEDYILANTVRDNMRVSVFTGPVFAPTDPVIHGLMIPVRFWKVVAFTHDLTGVLAATGYVASQARAVADLQPSFVFGDVENQQRPLAAIEAMTGLTFGNLTTYDVLAGAGVDFAASLRDVRDIMLA